MTSQRNSGGLLGLAFAAGLVLLLAAGATEAAPIISTNTNATQLVNNIVGSGVTVVGTPTYTGGSSAAGTFTNGGSDVGFASGVILMTGNVAEVSGTNTTGPETVGGGGTGDDDVNTSLGLPGDAQLTALAGWTTYDAAVLSFTWQFGDGSVGGDLYFNFVFASEEYIDYIGSQYNDAFGLFIDGVNYAKVNGSGITINNINNTSNSAYYVNNVSNTNGIPNANLGIRFDGRTTVLTATVLGLGAGTHTMKFAIADTSDGLLDSGVFVQAGTFSSEPTNPIPEPGTFALLGLGLGLFGLARARRRRG